MPSHDFFPPFEVGPFYCTYEDDRWGEPEIIVDPLSGFVVAIVPPQDRPVRPRRIAPRKTRAPSLWRDRMTRWLGLAGVSAALFLFAALPAHAEQSLLNVSYDPTRELYADYNKFFAERWKAQTGETVSMKASHSGSGAHAAVLRRP